MILDLIDNLPLYRGFSENLSKAIDYILNNNLNNLAVGKHEIFNDDVFVIINEYETKNESDCVIETHKKYIDIQIMLQGEEKVGFAFLKNQKITEQYNEEKDYTFYSAQLDYQYLRKDNFAIFFPTDLHSPSIKIDNPKFIKKAVVKVRV